MPSMAIIARSRCGAETTAEGWPASTEVMYRDVLYADFAGAKIGDAAKAGPGEAALGLAEKDN